MRTQHLFFACFVLTGLVTETQVQALETAVGPAEKTAAQQGLQDIKRLSQLTIKEGGPRGIQSLETFGIQSVNDVSGLGLGDPMRVYRVNFGQLKQYQASSDAVTLLVDANRIMYPLKVDREVRSLLVITKTKEADKWKVTEKGLANLAKILLKYRKTKSDIAVWIPEMNLYFIGTDKGGELNLISLGDFPTLGLTAGSSLPANQVFSRLQPEAKAHKGGFR